MPMPIKIETKSSVGNTGHIQVQMSSTESLETFRTMVSQVFRLTMAVSHGEGNNAVHNFDQFLNTAMNLIVSNESNKRIQNELSYEASKNLTSVLLERENKVCTLFEPAPVSPRSLHINSVASPTLVIHPDTNVDVVVTKEDPVAKNEVKNIYVNSVVHPVVKAVAIGKPKPAEVINVVEDDATVDMDADNEAEEDQDMEVEAEEAEDEEVEVEEEAEEEEAEEEEAEEEEAEEAEEEEAEEEEAEEEVEEEEEAEEEDDEAMEVVKIGKKNYFVGEHSKLVYVYINDEEAGDCLGKYVNGKIVPAA